MDVLTVLRNARARIAKGWCQHYCSKDENGDVVLSTDKRAVKFCAVGAVEAEAGSNIDLRLDAFFWLNRFTESGIINLNDTARSVNDVLAVFDKAIERQGGAV